jgi:hypothetical protein
MPRARPDRRRAHSALVVRRHEARRMARLPCSSTSGSARIWRSTAPRSRDWSARRRVSRSWPRARFVALLDGVPTYSDTYEDGWAVHLEDGVPYIDTSSPASRVTPSAERRTRRLPPADRHGAPHHGRRRLRVGGVLPMELVPEQERRRGCRRAISPRSSPGTDSCRCYPLATDGHVGHRWSPSRRSGQLRRHPDVPDARRRRHAPRRALRSTRRRPRRAVRAAVAAVPACRQGAFEREAAAAQRICRGRERHARLGDSRVRIVYRR